MSVYSADDWIAGEAYSQHTIIKREADQVDQSLGLPSPAYFYCIASHDNVSTKPEVDATNWAGYGTAADSSKRPKFLWTPSYGVTNTISPRTRSIKLGDGYEQRMADGINTVLLSVGLTFETRTQAETEAISHFLHQRGGHETFLFTPLPPYDKEKLFLAREWNSTYNFFDNYSVSVSFEELPLIS
jgi:phage-related protein